MRHRIGRLLRGEEDREPAIGNLAGELEVLGADRCEVEGNVLAHGMHGEGEGLAGAVRQREGEEFAVEGDALAGECHPDDRDILAGALKRLGEANTVPALGDLRP